jgi:hypothetical protein
MEMSKAHTRKSLSADHLGAAANTDPGERTIEGLVNEAGMTDVPLNDENLLEQTETAARPQKPTRFMTWLRDSTPGPEEDGIDFRLASPEEHQMRSMEIGAEGPTPAEKVSRWT